MSDLQPIIYYSMFFVLFAVFVILMIGIGSMLRGGKFNDKWGNKLMRARVFLQFIAIVLILLVALFFSK